MKKKYFNISRSVQIVLVILILIFYMSKQPELLRVSLSFILLVWCLSVLNIIILIKTSKEFIKPIVFWFSIIFNLVVVLVPILLFSLIFYVSSGLV